MVHNPGMDVPSDEESVGRSTYESLVRLTFLCGRGLGPEELARRFIAAIRPRIPARGAWLYQGSRLVAADADTGERRPPAPTTMPLGLAPQVNEHGRIAAPVLPGMTLICKLSGGSVQRAADVVSLSARVIALAWQAELVARDEPWDDDYLAAKATFKRRWLRSLVRRHGENLSAAARAAGLSRSSLYSMLQDAGLPTPTKPGSSDAIPVPTLSETRARSRNPTT